MANAQQSDSNQQLSAELRRMLIETPPSPQHLQSSPDRWQLTWYQTASRLQHVIRDCEAQATLRRKRGIIDNKRCMHFRSRVDVESGVVDVVFETEHNVMQDSIRPSVFVFFEPHSADSVQPTLQATIKWNDIETSIIVENDEATFPQFEYSRWVAEAANHEAGLEFLLQTVE